MSERVLVTGGAGYLGCRVVAALLARGVPVTVLDRGSWGFQGLMAAAVPWGHKDQLHVVPGNVWWPPHVEEALKGCTRVVHLAGIVGYPACDADPQDAEQTNVRGTEVLCEAITAQRGGLNAWDRPGALLLASTGSTYGKVDGVADESTPISPLTRYGRTKAAAEALVLDIGGIALRFATLYGLSPRMRWDLLPHDFARRAVETGEIRLYDGHARRTFLHVENATDAVVAALERGPQNRLRPGEVYNVGMSGSNQTKAAVATAVQKLTGCTITATEGHDPDERDYAVSYDKILEALPVFARSAQWSIAEALPEVIAWARVGKWMGGWR